MTWPHAYEVKFNCTYSPKMFVEPSPFNARRARRSSALKLGLFVAPFWAASSSELEEVQILDESEVIGFFSNPVCPLCLFELSILSAFAVCKTLDKMFEFLFNMSRNSPTMVCKWSSVFRVLWKRPRKRNMNGVAVYPKWAPRTNFTLFVCINWIVVYTCIW